MLWQIGEPLGGDIPRCDIFGHLEFCVTKSPHHSVATYV
ncbi:hypothetical protein APHNYW_1157 [Anaplasma phagocytophilum str. ApNYW]|nr:hypothetical protein APHNYW_1157 [Anaplasma phagocytophilum str. ApNYW]